MPRAAAGYESAEEARARHLPRPVTHQDGDALGTASIGEATASTTRITSPIAGRTGEVTIGRVTVHDS